MEKQSTKKLIALSGALVMFSFNVTNAQINSSDLSTDITQLCTTTPSTNSYQLDLNNDGIKDFSLDFSSKPNPACCVSSNIPNQPIGTGYEVLSSDNFSNNTNFTVNPNPFSNATNITFTLNQSEKVSMIIVDLNGRLIKNMLNDYLEAGDYMIQCNSENLNSGIYYLQTKTGETLQTEKLIVSK